LDIHLHDEEGENKAFARYDTMYKEIEEKKEKLFPRFNTYEY
jgi:hypothetical protein